MQSLILLYGHKYNRDIHVITANKGDPKMHKKNSEKYSKNFRKLIEAYVTGQNAQTKKFNLKSLKLFKVRKGQSS